jgi:hypothetical protein
MTRREEQRLRNKIREGLQSDEAMTRFMDDMFGAGNHAYDREADLWVASDPDHHGEGTGLILVKRGGLWQKIVLSGSALQ